MQNTVKKTYLKTVPINHYVKVLMFETKDYFGVEVEFFADKSLNKRNQYKKSNYSSLDECRQKALARFFKHISEVNRIIEDSQFQR